MSEAFICDGIRTPIGRYGGALSSIRADDLAALPIQYLMNKHSQVNWFEVDDVIMGCANQAGEDNRNVARMASLLAGLPANVPGSTINRLCGSGLDAVGSAARAIRSGDADLMIAAGVESMSRAPFVMPKALSAFSRQNNVEDTTIGWRFVNKLMKSQYGVDSMPETAENVAEQFNISRQDQDAFALRSQQRTAEAQANGYFETEIMPVSVPQRKGEDIIVDQDEHPRAITSLEGLAGLKTPFKENGSVTAGNASGVNDGSAAILLASEQAANRHGLTPKARIIGMTAAGVEPRIMGYGPTPAVKKLLQTHNLKLSDFGLIELNEAFAAQALAVTRALGLDDDSPIVNPNGGAIALGHPLGMSGTRLVLTAVNQMHKANIDRAICTMCIGVGQGIAIALERV